MKMRKLFAGVIAAATAVTAMAVAASAYEANLCFQTGTYCYRDEYDNAAHGFGSVYWDKFVVNCDSGEPDEKPEIEDYFDYDQGCYLLPATYTPATITADGEYTIKAEHDFWGINKDASFNLIHISTDIPYDENVKVTSATIIVDGTEVKTVTPVMEPNKTHCLFNVANTWNSEVGAFEDAFPTKSLEVKFTIEGLGSADAGADDKGENNPDTGVEGIAVVAGLAIVAAGAIVVAKKRG